MKKNVMILLAGMMFVFIQNIHAVPASPYPVQYVLPDGDSITIQLHGDEFFHWTSTEDGYTLLLNPAGYYEYASQDEYGNLKCSGIRAHNPEMRITETAFLQAIPKYMVFSEEQQYVGKQMRKIQNDLRGKMQAKSDGTPMKVFLILAQFKDLKFTTPNVVQTFSDLMNQPGYNKNGFTGSAFDYFYDNSCGKLILITDVVGPYTASRNMADYGTYEATGTRMLVNEMIDSADVHGINFADYDNNKDAILDALYIIYAGKGENQTNNQAEIWPHETKLVPPVTRDDVQITGYSCSAELWVSTTRQGLTGLGVIVHEFSHALGIADYYDTDGAGSGGTSKGIGSWDVMASGPYNNEGITPPFHNAYSREQLGWQQIKEWNSSQQVSLPKWELNDLLSMQAYKIITPKNGQNEAEYFIFENRQPVKWDAFLPGSGLLVWKIDEKIIDENRKNNCINCDPKKQGMLIVPSNNGYDLQRDSSATFPDNGKTEFTNTSAPNMVNTDGYASYYVIKNIVQQTDGVVTLAVQEDSDVHFAVDICGKQPVNNFTQTFNQVTVGNDINVEDWNTVDAFDASLKWVGGQKNENLFAEISPASLNVGTKFDTWLISPLLRNGDPSKNITLTFLQSKNNWESSYTADMKALQCINGKTYYQDIKVSDYPATGLIYNVQWRKFTKNITGLSGDFAIAFRLSGVAKDTNVSLRIDSVVMVGTAVHNQSGLSVGAKISINPNPVLNMLHVFASETISTVVIYDLFGRAVREEKPMTKKAALNVEALAPGVYILRCTYSDGTASSVKMIKK